MEKKYAVGKDGLPMTRFCSYLEVGSNDLDKITKFCKENNIPCNITFPDDLAVKNEMQEYILGMPEMEDNIGFDINNIEHQKRFISMMENDDELNDIANTALNGYCETFDDLDSSLSVYISENEEKIKNIFKD
jgi:hypothetical protein